MSSLVDRREVQKLLVIAGALRGGLVDALAAPGGYTAEELAARAGTDRRATRVVLDALMDIGVVSDDGGRFRLTEEARRHLIDPGPDLERDSILHQTSIVRGWLELPQILREGRPPEERGGGQGDLRAFVRTMAEGDPAVLEELVDRCLAYAGDPAPRTVLDAGGAVGHVALAFARRGIEATVCDRAEVLEEAVRYLEERGEAGRVGLVACDFREDLPPGPFDLVYLGNVYHIYGPDTNYSVTRRVFATLSPGGVIAIRDFVYERSSRSAMFAVNMLQATQDGGVWREAEFREWLTRAGFVDVRIVDLEHSANQLITGRRPL